MQKNLVIVESPAKAKTIGKFLGEDYKVLSSYGHIRDLKKKSISIDYEHDFQPTYEVPTDKRSVVNELKKEAKDSDMVWLASDEDREGEAISWHLYEVLGLTPENSKRIVFHEITKSAILNAIQHPRQIDINLVNAQQARRILDRIVGFELSPVLWRKVKPSLSAGRVQSVCVRLIVEREREVINFKPQTFYRVYATFTLSDLKGQQSEIKADLNHRFDTPDEAQAFLEECKNAKFYISSITKKPVKRYPAPPFTTSTLQQEAARKLGFSVSKTMLVAQQLYELGQITYMRTDSVNLSQFALDSSKDEIIKTMGEKYSHSRQYNTTSKGAQEAHEAIRPTNLNVHETTGDSDFRRLYDLIWKRTVASQMTEASVDRTIVNINIENDRENHFIAAGEVIVFDGFLRLYKESFDDDAVDQEDEVGLLPPMEKGQVLQYKKIQAAERYTQHPPRYSEASLVHKLEELGIGRPSTYAPTISTIQQRQYIEKESREGKENEFSIFHLTNGEITKELKKEMVGAEKLKLIPTDVGIVVNDFLTQYFPDIMDYNFTATVEKEFDEIAEGDKKWTSILQDFYSKFHPEVVSTTEIKFEHKVGERILGKDPVSGRQVSVKIGRFGPIAQIGKAEEDEKPKFSSLRKNQSIETITIEEVLELFKLPRTIGIFESLPVVVNIGRFGPYVHHGSLFISIPKGYDPMDIDMEQAQALILAKREVERKKYIKSFDDEPELQVLNGRYGPYISYKGNNYKIPATQKPEDLTLELCYELIKTQGEKPEKVRKTQKKRDKATEAAKAHTVRKSAKNGAAAKKAAAKKAAAKKV